MTINKRKVIDQVITDEHGNVSFREATIIEETDEAGKVAEISRSYHRGSTTPNGPTDHLPEFVKKVAVAAWNEKAGGLEEALKQAAMAAAEVDSALALRDKNRAEATKLRTEATELLAEIEKAKVAANVV